MYWFGANWFFILMFVLFIGMHFFGHGGHGGHRGGGYYRRRRRAGGEVANVPPVDPPSPSGDGTHSH